MDGGGEEERIGGKRRKEASERDTGERGPSPASGSWGWASSELAGGTCRCLQLQDRARLSVSVSVWPSAQQRSGRRAAAS